MDLLVTNSARQNLHSYGSHFGKVQHSLDWNGYIKLRLSLETNEKDFVASKTGTKQAQSSSGGYTTCSGSQFVFSGSNQKMVKNVQLFEITGSTYYYKYISNAFLNYTPSIFRLYGRFRHMVRTKGASHVDGMSIISSSSNSVRVHVQLNWGRGVKQWENAHEEGMRTTEDVTYEKDTRMSYSELMERANVSQSLEHDDDESYDRELALDTEIQKGIFRTYLNSDSVTKIYPGDRVYLAVQPDRRQLALRPELMAEMSLQNAGNNQLKLAKDYEDSTVLGYIYNNLWRNLEPSSLQNIDGVWNCPLPNPLCPIEATVVKLAGAELIVDIDMPEGLAYQWFSPASRFIPATPTPIDINSSNQTVAELQHHVLTSTLWHVNNGAVCPWMMIKCPSNVMTKRAKEKLMLFSKPEPEYCLPIPILHCISRMHQLNVNRTISKETLMRALQQDGNLQTIGTWECRRTLNQPNFVNEIPSSSTVESKMQWLLEKMLSSTEMWKITPYLTAQECMMQANKDILWSPVKLLGASANDRIMENALTQRVEEEQMNPSMAVNPCGSTNILDEMLPIMQCDEKKAAYFLKDVNSTEFPSTSTFPTDSTVSPQALYNPLPKKEIERAKQALGNIKTLNEGQAQAIMTALHQSLSIIYGPPGTGKTNTILNLVWVWCCVLGRDISVNQSTSYPAVDTQLPMDASLPNTGIHKITEKQFTAQYLSVPNDESTFPASNNATQQIPSVLSADMHLPQAVEGRGKVLVSAYNNIPIDDMCIRLLQLPGFRTSIPEERKRIVRVGHPRLFHPDQEKVTLDAHLRRFTQLTGYFDQVDKEQQTQDKLHVLKQETQHYINETRRENKFPLYDEEMRLFQSHRVSFQLFKCGRQVNRDRVIKFYNNSIGKYPAIERQYEAAKSRFQEWYNRNADYEQTYFSDLQKLNISLPTHSAEQFSVVKHINEKSKHHIRNILNIQSDNFKLLNSFKQRVLMDADVVVATAVGSGHWLLDVCAFSLIILDECSQMTEQSSLIPLGRLQKVPIEEYYTKTGFLDSEHRLSEKSYSRIVLCGDNQQLPPFQVDRRLLLCGEGYSMLERLSAPQTMLNVTEQLPSERHHKSLSMCIPQPVLLRKQYRMHADQCTFISTEIYRHQLVHATPSEKIKHYQGIPWAITVTKQEVPRIAKELKLVISDNIRKQLDFRSLTKGPISFSFNSTKVTGSLQRLANFDRADSLPLYKSVQTVPHISHFPIFLVDVDYKENYDRFSKGTSKSNDMEASTVIYLVYAQLGQLRAPSVSPVLPAPSEKRTLEAQNNAVEQLKQLATRSNITASDIGIISMYSQQTNKLQTEQKFRSKHNDCQKHVEVKSVDGFQGREKNQIILSTVRSEKVGFTDNMRRMNVALSRAQSGVIVVCNCALYEKREGIWSNLVKYAKEHNAYLNIDSLWKRFYMNTTLPTHINTTDY